MSRKPSWTVAISFGGNWSALESLYRSITDMEGYDPGRIEILVAHEEKVNHHFKNLSFIQSGSLGQAWITRKKNDLMRYASGDFICLLHDYLRLDQFWLRGFDEYGYGWNVATSPTLNPYREYIRVNDWMTLDSPLYGLALAPYTMKVRQQSQYVSGMYFCVRKEFIIKNNHWLDERLYWGDAEDQEWSRRVRRTTTFHLNAKSTVYTQKDKYYDFIPNIPEQRWKRWSFIALRVWRVLRRKM